MSIEVEKGRIGEKVVYFASVTVGPVYAQGYTMEDALWELYEEAGDELNALRVEIVKAMLKEALHDKGNS